MAYTITDACTNCSACEAECPNTAISQGPDIFMIDPNKCTECVTFNEKPACAAVCPVDACIPDPAHTETEAQLVEKVKKLHPGKPVPANYPSRFKAA